MNCHPSIAYSLFDFYGFDDSRIFILSLKKVLNLLLTGAGKKPIDSCQNTRRFRIVIHKLILRYNCLVFKNDQLDEWIDNKILAFKWKGIVWKGSLIKAFVHSWESFVECKELGNIVSNFCLLKKFVNKRIDGYRQNKYLCCLWGTIRKCELNLTGVQMWPRDNLIKLMLI